MSIEPYKIAIPDAKLERLKQKLTLTELPDELNGAGWDMGAPLADIKRLVKYWEVSFDWRKAEAKLNEMPQFTTDIDVKDFGTLNVHFVHQESTAKSAIPLLFVHGWPGSFIEVSKMLAELSKGSKDHPAFHVVAPSLPNYGFSQGVNKRGFEFPQVAETFHKLMLKLGYSQYVTQGGDLGYAITRHLALLYPLSCRANHINMAIPAEPTLTSNPKLYAQIQATPLTEAEKAGLARSAWFDTEGSGYFKEHSTKPQTLGYSLSDSPVGLLAWIYEKLHDWTDSYPWTDDEVLTWISIYYFSTAGPAAPQRIYYEGIATNRGGWGRAGEYIPDVKLGIARFPKELALLPKLWAKGMGDLVFESEWESGGHFAAWERPDAIVDDLRKMFGKGGGASGIVEGKSGFDD